MTTRPGIDTLRLLRLCDVLQLVIWVLEDICASWTAVEGRGGEDGKWCC